MEAVKEKLAYGTRTRIVSRSASRVSKTIAILIFNLPVMKSTLFGCLESNFATIFDITRQNRCHMKEKDFLTVQTAMRPFLLSRHILLV